MSWTIEKADEQFELISKRAAEDAQFLALLLAEPKRAIREFTGMDLPEGMDIVFSMEENGELRAQTKVAKPSTAAERELDEAELEHVAGGTTFASFIQYEPGFPRYTDKKR
ncbi:hypothetical protein [Paenibacillus hamazuiensis]|uniref:hypothetical protein n=1 Tax=Paenibacillus hamazuiensis TaxID=2936508 RepID=UPI00200FD29F|nr:hypothetical protein [Paenibacillus hamazuiensis]